MKEGDEMVMIIMVIGFMFFFIGFFFEKAVKIAANEWKEARFLDKEKGL
ncbi:MAG: hypothetical protein L0J35_00145 [Tetragenococcus halophilus]|nr:hypothetical protein [Tetragenococcus halophilus]